MYNFQPQPQKTVLQSPRLNKKIAPTKMNTPKMFATRGLFVYVVLSQFNNNFARINYVDLGVIKSSVTQA